MSVRAWMAVVLAAGSAGTAGVAGAQPITEETPALRCATQLARRLGGGWLTRVYVLPREALPDNARFRITMHNGERPHSYEHTVAGRLRGGQLTMAGAAVGRYSGCHAEVVGPASAR